MHYFDRSYTLDALGRLLGEDRGDWNGSSIATIREDRDWTLGLTGNWATRIVDRENDGTDEVNDLNPLTGVSAHFNNANEWRKRDTDGDGTDDRTLDYDANGNLIDDGADYDYVYDAWNRLATVYERGTTNEVAEYRYNGLGQRIFESDGTTDEYLIYDDRWRLISRADSSSDYLEETVHQHAGLDGYGGASDVDSVIMRRTFLSTGSPQTEDERWYVLQNWRQDPVVVMDEASVQRERAHFSPYGRVFGMVAGDTDATGFDGDYDGTDESTISGWAGASLPYRAYVDIDLDGDVDTTDAGYTASDSMGWDVLSRDGSTIGYAGYVQDDYVPTLNHVRHRVLKTDLGRWVQRDPAGYVDGASLYEYVRSTPIKYRDQTGLAAVSAACAGLGCDTASTAFGGDWLYEGIGEWGAEAGVGECCFPIKAGVMFCIGVKVTPVQVSVCRCEGLMQTCTRTTISSQICITVSIKVGVRPGCKFDKDTKKKGFSPAGGAFIQSPSGCPPVGSSCSSSMCINGSGAGFSCKWCFGDRLPKCSFGFGWGRLLPKAGATLCAKCERAKGDPDCACDYLD
ncbi:MAG: RHS repeat-associated core domain-containing protein [Phycisphaerales bacterium]